MPVPRKLQFHVWLVDSEPPIWRRFQISDQATLADLHLVLQGVMGWQNRHPYQFRVQSDRGSASPQTFPADREDTHLTALSGLALTPATRLTYTYDLGDGWLHHLTLEDISPAETIPVFPHCLDGARACPLESSGGIWGYEDLLERLADPEEPDYEALLDKFGLDFNPEAFDISTVNQRLSALAHP